ncbi:ZapG family protein [Salinicola halimionae]|uniref:ZapG family protein n=1 Tax=Salinicola halimionae TaxID=1949081 RepID=UPI000DA15A76|nr:DUF1043 family protein [Salinicola halimionae]
MESIGVGPWIAIAVAVGAIGVLVGYWLGTRMGGHNTEPMRELNREHKVYKEDVREHFEQVSATMTRMVEDYREMYQHVAKGAEKLADMHHETVIEPPPKPEAITQDLHEPEASSGVSDKASDKPSEKISSAEKPAAGSEHRASPGVSASPSAATSPGVSASPNASASSSASASSPGVSASPSTTSADVNAGHASDSKTAASAASSTSRPSSERPQDAAIRAAAEDAATQRGHSSDKR